MKFGKYLAFYMIPEWTKHYLDYCHLKQILRQLSTILKGYLLNFSKCFLEREFERSFASLPSPSRLNGSSFENSIEMHPYNNRQLSKRNLHRPGEIKSYVVSIANEQLSDEEIVIKHWIHEYTANVDKVNDFYLSQLDTIMTRIDELKGEIKKATVTLLSLSKNEQDKSDFAKGVKKRAEHGAKDELENATSWNRAFADILVLIRWLDGYCSINLLATRKIIKKFVKITWGHEKSEHGPYLHNYTVEKDFAHPTRLGEIKKSLIEYFSSVFTDGDIRQGRKMLDMAHPKTRPKDIFISSFFLGMTVSLMVVALILLFIPGDYQFKSDYMYSALPVFRYTLIIDLCLFGLGVVVTYFRRYAVNYIYIFQLDPNYRIREAQINRVALFILYIWLLCFFLQILTFKYEFIATHSAVFAFTLFIALTVLYISPFRFVYRGARVEMIRTMWNIIISPISEVRFKDFFLADIFCSMVKPFQDMVTTFCFFTSESWVNNTDAHCPWLKSGLLIIAILPYYWRFMQCLRKYYDTKDKFPHLVNAGKYMSSITTMTINLLNYWYNLHWENYYFTGYFIATVYCFIWDITMDWGLMRGKPRYIFLREKLLYPAKFYYFSIVTNFLLRFTWVLTMFKGSFLYTTKEGQNGLLFFLAIGEAYRRVQWSLFRVENENVNNFEKYRAFLEIPQLAEEEQEYQLDELYYFAAFYV
eukprot:TRINITY_DN120435_c3_g1_i1.p1 TRINITY_DN120435_c3_g1~~TRINITY_DN120435_c3_g1_i1.p1  ORF type:complete len:700 (+),score=58.28 TRINITY_DN120435_c3_g1_i1:6770-8869(+)